MIAFERVTARYAGAPQPTLVDVGLTADRGIITAVVGPNGSGKTTLVRVLLGRVPIISGCVMVAGRDLATRTRRDVAREVAVVVQREEPVFPMPVREYVALGRYPHSAPWSAPDDDDARVARAVESAGIPSLETRSTDTLSGGEWQRVRIARALAQDTPVLVMDEPTTFLDVAHEMETFELLARMADDGRTVLVVSHELNLVARFAQQVVLLHRGRVVIAGSPEEVMQAPTLEGVYEWPLVVSRDPAVGTPTLVPLRKRRS
jgi:iron complex transport system ATP-binding protein